MGIIQFIVVSALLVIIIYNCVKAIRNIYNPGAIDLLWTWLLVIFIGKD